MDFFTSDIHFGHRNVIRFCNRPFKTVKQMNEEIIHKWNSHISDKDRVFVIGDVFLCDLDDAKKIISQLNGYKILIKGNHDRSKKTMLAAGFDEFHLTLDYEMPDGRKALLKHYPLPDCLLEDYDLMIHGHIHVAEKINGKKINVSCDIWKFSPVSIGEITSLSVGEPKVPDEICNVSVSEDKILNIQANIHMADFAGLTDYVYSVMRDKWKEEREE